MAFTQTHRQTPATLSLDEASASFFDESSLPRGAVPAFKLLVGGICTGKTTLRNARYASGFVVVDAAEVFFRLSRGAVWEFPSTLGEPMDLVGHHVAGRALHERRHVVTEVIGDSAADLRQLIDTMQAIGYRVDMEWLNCSAEQARHRRAARRAGSVSASVAQAHHVRWLLGAAGALAARMIRTPSLCRSEAGAAPVKPAPERARTATGRPQGCALPAHE